MVLGIGIEIYKIEDVQKPSKKILFSFKAKDTLYNLITSSINTNDASTCSSRNGYQNHGA